MNTLETVFLSRSLSRLFDPVNLAFSKTHKKQTLDRDDLGPIAKAIST